AKLGRTITEIDLTTTPPSAAELRSLIARSGRPYTDFLNRSGILYRERNMKERVKTLPEGAIVTMLSAEGRLLKRPIVTDGKRVTVGFSPDEFTKVWGG
ncbi:MAG: ArsC/Spx/MgsR family protein, partial [Nitrospiria bacterium]